MRKQRAEIGSAGELPNREIREIREREGTDTEEAGGTFNVQFNFQHSRAEEQRAELRLGWLSGFSRILRISRFQLRN